MNTNDYICTQAMSILRKRERSANVTSNDIAFLTSHLEGCPRCLADSIVIRAVMSEQSQMRMDELFIKRKADAVMARLSRESDGADDASWSASRLLTPSFAAASIALLVACYLLFAQTDSATRSDAPVVSTQPKYESRENAEIAAASQQVSPVVPPLALPPPLKTTETARKVLLPTGIRLIVQPSSDLEVQQSDSSGITLSLPRGEILASVVPRRKGPPFSVETPHGRITVVGTVFSVTVDGENDRVTVLRGKVSVTGPDGLLRIVRAGHRLLLRNHQRSPLPEEDRGVLSREADRLAFMALNPKAFTDWRWQRPVAPDAPLPMAAPEFAENPDRQRMISVQTKTMTLPVTESFSSSAPPALTKLLLAVRQHRLQGEWEKTAAAYQSLIDVYSGSKEASAALVALGDLQLNKLGHPGAALELFERYLQQPDTTVIEEALVGKAGAYRTLRQYSREQDVLEHFIERYPSSVHSTMVKGRLSTLKSMQNHGGPDPAAAGTQ